MKKIFFILFFIFSLSILLNSVVVVNAQTSGRDPICIPAECDGTYTDDKGRVMTEYEPDFNCATKKILDPETNCCENKCKEGYGNSEPVELEPEIQELITVFDTTIAIKGQFVPTIINVLVSTVLGFASIYALVVGVYTAGVKRANTTNEEEIAQANKTLVTIILGFILTWSFIFIVQVVASLLGLGSLNNLVLVQDNPGESNPEIVIQ